MTFFSHRKILNSPIFTISIQIPPISQKLLFPPTFQNFPCFRKIYVFFYIPYFICFSFPLPSLTMMHLRITQRTYWTPLLSVKLSIVLLRFIERNSKALNCDASKLLRLKYNYPRPVPSGPSFGLYVYVYSLPQSLYILLCECVFPCWTPTELVYPV